VLDPHAGFFYPVLVHALSLFGPGELRALRVGHADVFRVVLAMLDVLPQGDPRASQLAQALDSVCAIELPTFLEEYGPHAAAIIERCAATITELKGPLPGDVLCESVGSAGHPPVLARCTRLELLTHAYSYTPAVWLGLSQLHTLHGVDLSKVSIAAIAAALPKLHSLRARYYGSGDSAIAGFFTDLLPRLRLVHFNGKWPAEESAATASPPPLPLPLPLLKELVWRERSPHPTVIRGFLGARPIVLHAPYELIAEGLPAPSDSCPGEPASSLLARACELRDLHCGGTASADFPGIARVLRAAPRLRTFRVEPLLRGDASWLTASALPLGPLVNLFHPQLRHLRVNIIGRRAPSSRDDGCASRLRQTCFPRFRELEVNGETFFVTPDAD
jgi:hypothetical protein